MLATTVHGYEPRPSACTRIDRRGICFITSTIRNMACPEDQESIARFDLQRHTPGGCPSRQYECALHHEASAAERSPCFRPILERQLSKLDF